MAFDDWKIESVVTGGKREFILVLRDSHLTPASKGWQETSAPMSEEKLRHNLAHLNVPIDRANAAIHDAIASKRG